MKKAKLEKNPVVECNKIQRRYIPDLMTMFSNTADPRVHPYVTYSNTTMLSTLYYKNIGGIVSMQEIGRRRWKIDNIDNTDIKLKDGIL